MRYSLSIAVLFLLLAGCQSDAMRALDDEVAQVIRQREMQTLGRDAGVDPNPLTDRTVGTRPRAHGYDHAPPTTNPGADQLPATPGKPPEPTLPGTIPDEPAADATSPDQSVPAVKLDLEAALAYAIEHSPEYRNRKDDLFFAAINLLIEQHLWGPRFFDDITANFSGTPEAGDRDHVFSLVNSLRATQRLPYGGEVSVSAVVGFVEKLRLASGSEDPSGQDASVQIAAVIPLLRGAGIVAREDLIQAYRDLVYSVRGFERFRREFLVAIATNYFDLLQQQAEIRNGESQVKNLLWLSQRVGALADAGREPYFEVQRAQQQVLFARNSVLIDQERYNNALDAFKIRIGMPTTQPLEIVPVEVEMVTPKLDPTQSVKVAWDYRLDLQTTHDQIDDARRRVAVAKNLELPDLDLFANVTLPTDPDKTRSGLQFDAGAGRYNVGATLGLPLDRRIEKLQHRAALVQLERAQRFYTLQRDEIAADVRNSIRQITLAQTTLGFQTLNVELAQKRRDGVVLRLRTLGPRDFIESETDLLNALDQRDDAVRNLRVNVLRYLLDTGQMRVSPTGQWRAPAKLVPGAVGMDVPPASRLMGPQAKNEPPDASETPAEAQVSNTGS